MARLIHLVPHLPPEICGIGDYATLVGERMEDLDLDVHSLFLACGHRPTTAAAKSAATRDVTGACEPNSLWRAASELANEQPVDQVNVVLHYSGYGYAPNGAPNWLADAIEHRPAEWAECRVTTVFHELFATGRPWERAFWSSGRQQSVARRIAAASDHLITNRYESARWLEQARGWPTGSVPHLAVPSNVGEMERLPEWQSRLPTAVLFGGGRFKPEFLNRRAKETIDLCRRLDLRNIREIGAATTFDSAPFRAAGITIESMGWLPADQISKTFQRARVALIDYYPGYAAKSGVLAAAAAHGTPPIFLNDLSGNADGLYCGEQYLELNAVLSDSAEAAQQRLLSISRSIHEWYAPHTVMRHAETIADVAGVSPARAGPMA